MNLKVGDKFTYSRRFTRAEILYFAEISQDRGEHHIKADQKIIVHGLLLATMPTKIGGDLNFIARSMEFEFLKQVYEDEEIFCTGVVERIFEQKARYKAVFSFYCQNEVEDLVMQGRSSGLIWK